MYVAARFMDALLGLAAVSEPTVIDHVLSVIERVTEFVESFSGFLVECARWVFRHGLLVGLLIVFVFLGVLFVRFLCTRRMLEGRVVVFASAVDSWDPSVEEIARTVNVFARERSRRFSAGGRGRRIRLDSAPAGRVLFSYELSGDIARSLRANISDQIELRDQSQQVPMLSSVVADHVVVDGGGGVGHG